MAGESTQVSVGADGQQQVTTRGGPVTATPTESHEAGHGQQTSEGSDKLKLERTTPALDGSGQEAGDDAGTKGGDKDGEGTKTLTDLTPEQEQALAPFTEEFEKTGDLTAESVKKAAEIFKVPESMARMYVNGLKAERASAQTAIDAGVKTVHEGFGGEQAYTEFTEWARGKDGATDKELATYNRLLDEDPEAAIAFAKGGMYQRFQAGGGGPAPRNATAEASITQDAISEPGYTSTAQMEADMNDPRYHKDPAFRDMVMRKVQNMK